MTASEVKSRFIIELDAVASGAAPGFTDDEISELLTKAQKDFIQLKIKSGEWNDIFTLLDISLITLAGGDYGTLTKAASLPADYGYYCTSRVRITRTNPTIQNQWLQCDLIDASIMGRFLSTPFNLAYFKYPVVFLYAAEKFICTIVDWYTTYEVDASPNYELTYARIPADVDITAGDTLSIPDAYFETVIEMAVQEAVKSLKLAKMSTQ
jgi:hypothetical protein